MADFGSPVAAGVNTTGTGMKSLSELMNLQTQGLALQKSKATQAADIARSIAESQHAQTAATVAAGTAQPTITSAQETAKQAQIKSNLDQFKLTGDYAQKARDISQQLVSDPDVVNGNIEGIIPKIKAARQMMVDSGIPENVAEVQAAHLMQAAASDPKSVRQLLLNSIQAGVGSAGQAANIQQTGIPVTDQRTSQVIANNPLAAVPPGQPIPGTVQQQLLPPTGTAQRTTVDALGRPVIEVTSASGEKTFQPPPDSPYKPIMALPPGESQGTAQELYHLRDNAQQAAAQAPSQHFNNQQILNLSADAFTGTGSDKIAAVLNHVGIPFDSEKGSATAQLQHFLALQVEQNAAAQGASTDAARKLAAQAVLPGSSPEQAIKAITKVNEAYVTGSELFNQGLQAAVKDPKNTKDIFAVRDFQNAWSKNMDPRIFQLENAAKAGDKAEISRIKAQLGASGIAELQRKAKALQGLIGAANGP